APRAFSIALSITWAGTCSCLAFSIKLRKAGLPSGSGTPFLANTYSFLPYLEYSLDFCAAVLKIAFLRFSKLRPITVLFCIFKGGPCARHPANTNTSFAFFPGGGHGVRTQRTP